MGAAPMEDEPSGGGMGPVEKDSAFESQQGRRLGNGASVLTTAVSIHLAISCSGGLWVGGRGLMSAPNSLRVGLGGCCGQKSKLKAFCRIVLQFSSGFSCLEIEQHKKL